jgi:hypothetical protein
MKTNRNYTAQSAQQRVMNTPELRPHYSTICEYDWPNAQEHINWVCTAPISEIVDWAKTIEEE